MIRLLAAAGVLALSLPGAASPLSRWTTSELQGIDAVAVAGRSDSALLAAFTDLSVRRSLDGGKTWTRVAIPGVGPVYTPSRFAIGSPHDSRTWILHSLGDGGGVHLTRDGGESWTRVVTPVPTSSIAFGATSNLLYVPGSLPDQFSNQPGRNAQASLDGGITWRATAALPRGVFVDKITPSLGDARSVYAWGSKAVFRSDDQGVTWREVTPSFAQAGAAGMVSALSVDAVDPDIVYASAFGALERGAWTSRDGGRTWTRAPLEWIVNTAPDPSVRSRAFAFSFDATVYETRDAGLTWAIAERAQFPGSNPMGTFSPNSYKPLSLAVVGGRRSGLNVANGKLSSVDLNDGALALGSDLWWNPAESGAGFTITQHATNRMFAVWYTYDATGAPVWRVLPDGRWNDRTLTGAMYETTGPAYFQGAFDPARVAFRPAGTARIVFDDQDNATLVHEVAGAAPVTKRIIRQLFASPVTDPLLTGDSVADLWWNAAEPGWGMAINHQYDRIFATWYVYGADGKPLWIVMPDARLVPDFAGAFVRRKATGDIYTTTGPAAGTPYDPAKVVVTKVGSASITFRDLGAATLDYTAFGRTESLSISRQPF